MQELLESVQVVTIIAPVDLTLGANSGDRVSLRNYRRCLFLFAKGGGGSVGQDPTVTLQEHSAATGGSSQNLVAITKAFVKEAATDLTAVGVFSVVSQAAAATFTDDTFAENAVLVGIEVKAEQLSDGFDFVSVNIADPGAGNAQIGAVLAILYEPRYSDAVGKSAIA